MPYLGWASLGGNELINSVRAHAYAMGAGIAAVRDPGVPQLPQIVGDGPRYESPMEDPAPWYDAAVDASARFLGVVGLSMVGLSAQGITRDPQETASGFRISAPRYTQSEAQFEAYLIACDEEGLSYGLGYLATVLRGTPCDTDCGGLDLCVFSGPPTGDGDLQRRTRVQAGPLSGVSVLEEHQLRGGIGAKVSFTLVFGSPWAFSGPVLSYSSRLMSTGVQQAVSPAGLVCPDGQADVVDPAVSLPAPPPSTPLPADPAYPVTDYTSRALFFESPVGVLPTWLEVVPVVTVRTGAAAMRRVSIRAYAKTGAADCASSLALGVCATLGDVGVAYLPPGAVAVFDGRTLRQWVETDESPPKFGRSLLRGLNGGSPRWPVIPCPVHVCLRVSAQVGQYAADATVAAEWWARSDLV